MAKLSDAQVATFADTGYLVLPGLAEGSDLDRAELAVDALIAASPPPVGHVGRHFYWRSPAEAPALFELVGGAGSILEAAEDLVGAGQVQVAFDQAQVALNIPPFEHRPGRPHIDGHQEGQAVPGTFTLLAAVLLSDQTTENTGNLWVWPGTHRAHADFFAAHGPEAFATAAGYPPIELPEPTQVVGRRGDVVLAHYLLGHNIGGNYEGDGVRRAVYWRLRAEGHPDHWAACLGDQWLEYDGVRRMLARGGEVRGRR